MLHRDSGLSINQRGIKTGSLEFSIDPRDIEVEVDSQLGRGSCGIVNRAVHKPTGTALAIKCVKLDDRDKRAQLMTDLQTLIKLQNCQNLVQLYSAYFHKQSGRVHVALELMDLGSLQDWLRYLPERGMEEKFIASIFLQISQALAHLHAHRQLHRDIKPGNVLINSKGEVKVGDFGISKCLDATAGVCDTFIGTAIYMSPERAIGASYSYSADIWSLGVILFELASGKFPFPPLSSFPALFDALCNQPEPRLENSHSIDLREAVQLTLIRDPMSRGTAEKLLKLPLCEKAAKSGLPEYLRSLKGSVGGIGGEGGIGGQEGIGGSGWGGGGSVGRSERVVTDDQTSSNC